MSDNIERKPRQAWEQIEGEPDEAYIHFLAYRNIGPDRSAAEAYRVFSGGIKRRKKQPPPGNWAEECSKWGWVARAHSWDIQQLILAGEQSAILLADSVRQGLLSILTVLKTKQPKSWAEAAEFLEKFAGYIGHDTIQNLVSATTPHPAEPDQRQQLSA